MAYFLPPDEMARFGGVPDSDNKHWTPRDMMTEAGYSRHEMLKEILFATIPKKEKSEKDDEKTVQDKGSKKKEQDNKILA